VTYISALGKNEGDRQTSQLAAMLGRKEIETLSLNYFSVTYLNFELLVRGAAVS
jgi:hypothetical protein